MATSRPIDLVIQGFKEYAADFIEIHTKDEDVIKYINQHIKRTFKLENNIIKYIISAVNRM